MAAVTVLLLSDLVESVVKEESESLAGDAIRKHT